MKSEFLIAVGGFCRLTGASAASVDVQPRRTRGFSSPIRCFSCFKLATQVAVFLMLFAEIRTALAAKALQDFAEGMPPGKYVIERVNLLPQPKFKTEMEAQQWAANARAHPQAISPSQEFYELQLRGDEFTIRAMRREPDGKFETRQNLFVGRSSALYWTFEEMPNVVTLLETNKLDSVEKDSRLGLFELGESLASEMRTLGLNLLALHSLKSGAASSFTGENRFGGAVAGNFSRDEAGFISSLWCRFLNEPTPYFRKFDVFSDNQSSLLQKVIVSAGEATEDWHPILRYQVITSDLPNPHLDFGSYWQTYTNAQTQILKYDFTRRTMLFRQRDGNYQVVRDSLAFGRGRARGMPPRRLIVRGAAVIVLVVSAGVCAWLVFRSRKSCEGEH